MNSDNLVGITLGNRYDMLEKIGTGGMATVYKAKDTLLNRYVAIKILRDSLEGEEQVVSNFIKEAQSSASLVHNNIVSVYDVGEENGLNYMVMEYVDGITLKEYIKQKGALPWQEACDFAIQIGQGISEAHSINIIHRDIKPQNILMTKDKTLKVTDFGIARAVAGETTVVGGSALGSVHYISPEQARGGYSDERSDIYSLGITLFEMLTGTVPFDGDSAVSVAVQHIQDSIPLPSQLVEGVPVSVDKIVLKCTQKKTDRRYQSAAELIVDLKKSLVMPDEDFVRMGSAYDSVLKKDEEEYNPDDDELLTESAGHDLDDDNDDTDDELLENDSDKDEDIDDERNDKLELVMKCIGIGIAVIILMITIFVVIKLVGNGKNTAKNNKNSEEATTVNTANNNSSDMVEVPAVVGMTKEDAIKALNKLGLGYKAVTQSSDTVAEDCVISQGNVGGSKVEKNSQIVLTISTGKENKEVTVPNVKGKSEQEAKEAIEAANLVASVDYQYSDSVEAGNVIKYSPSGSVAEGSTVTIHVSRGKKVTNVSVPNVLGMSESLASQTLDSANLKVTVKYETSSKAEYGTVTSQTPYSAGDSVPSGTTITIYVSHYQQTAQQTTTAANNKNNNGNSNNSSN